MRLSRMLLALALPATVLAAGCDIFTPGDDDPHALWISDTGIVLEPGESITLTAQFQEHGIRGARPSSAIEPVTDGRWWSENDAVIRVRGERRGEVEAVGPGTTTVWVEMGARRDSATVTVLGESEEPSRRWKDVSTWMTTTCALDLDGDAYCWGTNTMGELGNGPRRFHTQTHRPVRVDAPVRFVQVEAGTTFACGRTDRGEVWCWGVHRGSQLGHGRTSVDFEEKPVRVAFDGAATQLAVGSQHACLLDEAGRAHCWGSNLGYQLGIADAVASSAHLGGRTVPVEFDGTFVELASAAYNTCGITEDRDLYCWGLVSGGAPGVGREAPLPVRIETTAAPVQISPGDGGSCYLDAEGRAYCWGIQRLGMTGTTEVPAKIDVSQRFSSLTGPCGIDTEGRTWCWGMEGLFDPAEATEPCGLPSTAMCSTEPVSVSKGLRFRTISVGIAACGIALDGELYCWGSNEFAQLGIGRPRVESTHIPQRVLDPL